MSSPLIKIVEQPNMTSQQTSEKFFHCLIDSSNLEVTAYPLKKDYSSLFEVKNAA